MKLVVFTVLLSNQSFDDTLSYLSKSGVQAVKIGTGVYVGNEHANSAKLFNDDTKLNEFKASINKYNMEISALSCHGNAVHPQKDIAVQFNNDFEITILLAEKLGVERVVTFSGCPGDCSQSKYPNWVTCPWPEDYQKILEYQWNEVLIPYWKKAVNFAKSHGVNKICLEMHPGFCVYNPGTLLKLRDAVGSVIGANYDPSHLFWQGIDPIASLRILGDAIYYFHAKDTKVDEINTKVNGVLDTKHYSDELNRSWVFRTVGYGHDASVWKDIISTLRMIGYDYEVSIKHEDSLMSVNEGLQKSINFLKEVMTFEKTSGMWWK